MTEFFSERNGLIESMKNTYTPEFRSAIVTSFFNQYDPFDEKTNFSYIKDLMDLFGIEQHPQVHLEATIRYNMEQILEYFKNCPWNHLFDFTEYVLTLDINKATTLTEKYNRIFRMHGCKYRIVNGKVIPVANELEIQEIRKALNTSVDATNIAYSEAIALLSARTDPDYNAVISKASNALESMVLAIAEENNVSEKTLSYALTRLKEKGVSFEERMEKLIKSVYNYACNAGIRHGGTAPVAATEADAILVLLISAAGINYLNTIMIA